MSELELPVQLAVIRELETRLKKAKTAVQQQLLDGMNPGDSLGANVGDARVGRVTYVDGRISLYVADAAAFLAWVEQENPDQVIRQVAPDHQARVLNDAKASGELPPGVELAQGGPYLTFRATPGSGEVVAALWREHGIDVLQIEGA